MKNRFHSYCAALLAAVLMPGLTLAGDCLVQNGETIAFLGDSITANGWNTPGGYVKLVVDALAKQGIKVTPVPAGVSGNKSNEMLARLDQDVLSKNPNWMTLSCGVNDVWHGAKGVDLENYKKNITAIVDRAQAKGVKVVILTATVIGEEANNNNEKLTAYNDFLRSFTKERNLPLADLNQEFHTVLDPLSPNNKSRFLTVDGVHMNPEGNVLMAKGCLEALGISKDSLASIEKSWNDQKGTATISVYPFDPRPNLEISLGQYRSVNKMAEDSHTSVVELGRTLWLRALSEVVQKHAQDPVIDAEQVKRETNALLTAKIEEISK